jgi:hypothetical protein
MRHFLVAAAAALLLGIAPLQHAVAGEGRPLVLHVKTALSVDDAQICVVPNVAWAALSEGRPVTVVFDGSAVTSIAKGYGWRGWLGVDSTAMDRAELPERERIALAEQIGVPLGQVPRDYGDYLRFIADEGATVVYNSTMAVLYDIPPDAIEPVARPVGLKELLQQLRTEGDYLVY